MKLQTVKIFDLKFHPKNPNTHPELQVKELQNSLDQFDQVKNIVVWQGLVIAGNGLLEAAKLLNRETIEIQDVSDWPEEKALKFMIADNRIPQLAIMDDDILSGLLTGFDDPLDIPGIDETFLDTLMIDGQDQDNPTQDWEGMPEFNQGDLAAFKKLIIHFKNQQDIDNFSKLVKQKITEKTKYLWFPEEKKEQLINKKWMDG